MAAVRMAAATRAARLDTALLHFRRYDLDRSRPSGREVRGLAQKAGLRIAAPGEAIRAATVVLTYQPLPDQAMDRFPVVDHEQLVVVVNQMAEHGGRSDSERKEN